MNQYEQELAKWEADRKEMWDFCYDEYDCNGDSPSLSAAKADDDIRAWELRYPRPEPKSSAQQYPERPLSWTRYITPVVSVPDYIGCQELMYTRDGVKLSNGSMCSLEGLRALHKGSQLLHCRNGSPGLPDGYRFYGVGGYNGTYHNGYILIEGFRITTAQLAAMIERCEALAREPEVDLSKRWKVVFAAKHNPDDIFVGIKPNNCECPKLGFENKEAAQQWVKDRVKRLYNRQESDYAILPYLATSLPKKEKRWELWYKGDKMANPSYGPDEWVKAKNTVFKSVGEARDKYRAHKANQTLVFEIREVEVEVDE